MSKDEFYANTSSRIDTITGNDTWVKIVRAKEEFNAIPEENSFDIDGFDSWLTNTYGVKLNYTPDGMMSLDNSILDEKKYLMFLLKFGEK